MAKRPTRADLQAKLDATERLVRQALSAVDLKITETEGGAMDYTCRPSFLDCEDCKQKFWDAMVRLSVMYPGAAGTFADEDRPTSEADDGRPDSH